MKWRQVFNPHAGLAILFAFGFFLVTGSVEFRPRGVVGDTGYELTPPFFRLITAGFWPAAVDALWIRTLQGVEGNEDMGASKVSFSAYYKLTQALDPWFYESYEQGAMFFAFVAEETAESIGILDRGIQTWESGLAPPKFWTHPYTLYIFRGYVHAFLMGDFNAAKSDYLAAASLPGAPDYLSSMKTWLQQEGGEKKLAVRVLRKLADHATDVRIKNRYLEKLKKYDE